MLKADSSRAVSAVGLPAPVAAARGVMRVFGGAALVLCVVQGPASAQADPTAADPQTRPEAAESPSPDAMDAESAGLGPVRTLEQLLEVAHERAPTIRAARERLGLGDAAIEGAERTLPFNPELEVTGGPGLGGGPGQFEVMVRQRLEIGGQRGLRIDAAERRKDTLEADLARVLWEVHADAHRLYRVAIVDGRRVEVEQEILEFTQDLHQIAEERFQAGEAARTSVIVARAERATARQRLVQARTGYLRTLGELATTVGWPDAAPPQPAGGLEGTRDLPPTEALVAKAWAQDPQLAVLQARVDQARAEASLHEREVWPDPVVGLGYEREEIGEPNVNDKLLFTVGVPLPVWDRNQGLVASARARARVARQAIESRKGVLGGRIRQEVDSVRGAYRQARIYEEEVLPAFQEQLALLQTGFELGELTLLDVMNARDRLLAVQRQYLEAQQAYAVAVGELETLLGTSIWETEED